MTLWTRRGPEPTEKFLGCLNQLGLLGVFTILIGRLGTHITLLGFMVLLGHVAWLALTRRCFVYGLEGSSMERILERYERYSYAESQLLANEDTENNGSWTLEYAKLKARVEVLQRNQRHFMGEDLDSLSLKELQNLEHQTESALKHVRSRKNQLIYESISKLQKKDKALQEQNNLLAKKVKENEKAIAQQAQWKHQNPDLDSPTNILSQPRQPLNISNSHIARGIGDEEQHTPIQHRANALLPAWMLRHLNE